MKEQGKQCEMKGQVKNLDRLKASLGPYGYLISTAMVGLASAVEVVLNGHDAAVLSEMKAVAVEIFEQAEEAMNSGDSNIQ